MAKLTKKEKIKQLLDRGFTDEDIWNIDFWFYGIMPKMLRALRDKTDCYPQKAGSYRKWKNMLERQAKLFDLIYKMNDDEFKFNKYDKEYHCLNKEFQKKYGRFGDKLKTPEELEREKKEHVVIDKCLAHAPEKEYRDIYKKWQQENTRVWKRKEKLEKQALAWFAEYLNDLWW